MSTRWNVEQIPAHRRGVSVLTVQFRDENIQKKLMAAAALGMKQDDAAAYAGISIRQLERWMLRGEQQLIVDDGENEVASGPYGEFLLKYRLARASGLAHSLKKIREYGDGAVVAKKKTTKKRDGSVEVEETYAPGQWVAHAWLAERTHQDGYSLKPPTNLNVNHEIKLVVVEEDSWRGNRRTLQDVPAALIESTAPTIEAQFVEKVAPTDLVSEDSPDG